MKTSREFFTEFLMARGHPPERAKLIISGLRLVDARYEAILDKECTPEEQAALGQVFDLLDAVYDALDKDGQRSMLDTLLEQEMSAVQRRNQAN